jgi:hypothetical protein
MPILSQTLKGHDSETVCPFELKFFVETYFSQLYQRSTKEVLEIDQSIAIDRLSMPALGSPWPPLAILTVVKNTKLFKIIFLHSYIYQKLYGEFEKNVKQGDHLIPRREGIVT